MSLMRFWMETDEECAETAKKLGMTVLEYKAEIYDVMRQGAAEGKSEWSLRVRVPKNGQPVDYSTHQAAWNGGRR